MEKLIQLFNKCKFEEVLNELDNIDEGGGKYYELVLLKVRTLIKLQKFSEAIKIIETELSLPYIPDKFEQQIQELQIEINSLMPLEDKIKNVALEDLEKALFRNNDFQEAAHLIYNTTKLNLKPFLKIFSKYLLWAQGDDNLKSIIMFALKEGNMAGSFTVVKQDQQFNFKPAEIININELASFIFAKEIIEQAFFQEVSKQELAIELIFTKLFSIYPKALSKKEVSSVALKAIEEVKRSFT